MTPEQEQHLLAVLYSRLWQAISYTPPGKETAAFNPGTTFMHLGRGEVVNPADFVNPVTPTNPRGDLRSAERFSHMVDSIPKTDADYTPSADRVSTVYRQLLEAVQRSIDTGQVSQQMYDQAFKFLNTSTTIQDSTGKDITMPAPSVPARTYDELKLAYLQAVANYRTAYLGYDLSDMQQQRAWQVAAPLLQAAVDQAYNRWRRAGAAQVEQAQATLETANDAHAKDIMRASLQDIVQETVQMLQDSAFASTRPAGSPWYLAYALPTHWANPTNNPISAQLKLESSYLQAEEAMRYSAAGGGDVWQDGLWWVEQPAGEADAEQQHYHLEASAFELSAKVEVVTIQRPWLNPLVLKLMTWFVRAFNEQPDTQLMLFPTALLVTRDVQIKADFTANDRKHLEQSFAGTGRVGLGPIQLSGDYAHSWSQTPFHATEHDGIVHVPGLHILAWLSTIVPTVTN